MAQGTNELQFLECVLSALAKWYDREQAVIDIPMYTYLDKRLVSGHRICTCAGITLCRRRYCMLILDCLQLSSVQNFSEILKSPIYSRAQPEIARIHECI